MEDRAVVAYGCPKTKKLKCGMELGKRCGLSPLTTVGCGRMNKLINELMNLLSTEKALDLVIAKTKL